MSTTKRLSVKAVKPQDQTCASQAQAIIGHILDEKTTELNDAIDSAVYNSVLLGHAAIKMEGGPVSIGGFTDMVLTSEGLASSSSSVIQR